MSNYHHIQNPTEQYNNLVDFISGCWQMVFDATSDYRDVEDMIRDLAEEASKGITLRYQLATQASVNINHDFAVMRGLMKALEGSQNES